MQSFEFDAAFAALTGHPPFPWQRALYDRFVSDRPDHIPAACDLPTGLGKTSVIAVWLVALLRRPDRLPRRLVYVVNRRTVVDQTTDEVEKLRKNLSGLNPPFGELAVSTLRGQFADNRAWSADPSRPAVVCGTVDMIGSRLLFGGYGVGAKARPLHAGFLGQDALVVHDEAHLEPAFQELLVAIQTEQHEGERTGDLPWPKLRVMELSATPRGGGDVFRLTPADHETDEVRKRVGAKKAVHLHEAKDDKKLAEELADRAVKQHGDSGRAVLIFVRRVDDVDKIVKKLPKDSSEQLTGTLRGKERDGLIKKPIFQRFLPASNRDPAVTPAEGTVYLVCTSAGEVGVNISADDLVCDLSTFDSMAQRFGRVNRFGACKDTRIDIVHPKAFDADNDIEVRREKTLHLLRKLEGDGSPAALGRLDPDARVAAFAPPPVILPVSDILFDAWALTTVKGKLPGRPMIEPYLHGVSGWEPPETHVAWREEVERLEPKFTDEQERKEREAEERKRLAKLAADLLGDYPLKPHELLRDNSARVFDRLKTLPKNGRATPRTPVWLVADDETVEVTTLGELAEAGPAGIERKTVLLPPAAGGLEGGLLTSGSKDADDVSGEWSDADGKPLRARVWDNDPVPDRMHVVRTIDLRPDADEAEDESTEKRFWRWCEVANEGDTSSQGAVKWHVHVGDVERHAEGIVAGLRLDPDIADAVRLAAKFHDHGKRRKQFQTVLGNGRYPAVLLAKSGRKGGRVTERYRHEFGSLLDVRKEPEFVALGDRPEVRELVLHLIAAHHGRGRPHFPADEAFDPDAIGAAAEKAVAEVAAAVPGRFARLQRKYGRWGLAYLESLLRAADWAASGNPSEFVTEGGK